MSEEKLRDLRSLDILYGEANAWEKVCELCHSLGMRGSGSGLDIVLNFINDLHNDAMRLQRVNHLINVMSNGEVEKIVVLGEGKTYDNP